MPHRFVGLFCLCAALLASGSASAQQNLSAWTEMGATKDYYNSQAKLRWKNPLGDWRDADGTAQGGKPYAQIQIADNDVSRPETWDITALAKGWLSGQFQNHGVLLMAQGGGQVHFFSRQWGDPALHPQLIVQTTDGQEHVLKVIEDVTLHGSTSKSLGDQPTLQAGRVMVKFDLTPARNGKPVARALLRLHTTDKQYGGTATIRIFRPDPGHFVAKAKQPSKPASKALASKYPGDRGLAADPDVILFADFERFDWLQDWTVMGNDPRTIEPVDSAPSLGFEPLSGKALQVVITTGGHLGIDLRYLFAKEIGHEPEEVYFRYYIRLANDWNPTVQSGKMPGIAGTYDRAGWGGRRSNGTNGWSMRGLFGVVPGEGNPLNGLTPIGSYAYYGDMPDFYGSNWWWTNDGLGLLKRNRWYCVEQYVKLNSVGQKDGVMRAWIDGQLAFENRGILYRTSEALKIDRIWMNVYHGGGVPAPEDYHLYFDNIVVAKSYIGPIAGRNAQSQ